MFEVAQVDVSDTPLTLPLSATAGLSMSEEEENLSSNETWIHALDVS